MTRFRRFPTLAAGLAAGLAFVAVLSLALPACSGGSDTATGPTRPTTTVAPTTVAPTTSPTTPAESTAEAIWPWAASGTRYSDPVTAARGFAIELLGFTDPVVGEFRAGDSRSGEVDVRAKTVTLPVVVSVRQIGGSWWVLGATTDEIRLTTPAAGATATSPLAIAGTSTAFEAVVNVRLVADGAPPTPPSGDSGALMAAGPRTPLVSTTVMGGSMGDMGPFAGTLTFTSPGAGTSGTLVLLTLSAEDGRVVVATAVRVHFG